MKKIYLLLVLFGAFLLCACEKENIDPLVEDQAQTQVEESALKGAKKHPVPIKGEFVQTQKSLDDSHAEDEGYIDVIMDGKGKLSHLGKTHIYVTQRWNLGPILTGDATVVFTSASGDELWADLHASNELAFADIIVDGEIVTVPVYARVSGGGEFYGGTGRFENATGPYTMTAEHDLLTNTGTAFYEGRVKY